MNKTNLVDDIENLKPEYAKIIHDNIVELTRCKQTIKERVEAIVSSTYHTRSVEEVAKEIVNVCKDLFIGLIDEEIKILDEAWSKDKEISYADLLQQVKGLNNLKSKTKSLR